MPGLGTAINVATIIAGTGTGLVLGHRLPERARTTMLHGVGLITLALGVGEAVGTHNVVFPLVAIVAGGLVGELLRIEERLESVGERIRRRVERDVDPETEGTPATSEFLRAGEPETGPYFLENPKKSRFVEGFVAASLLFCVGPLTILGSIQDGLSGDIELLAVKAALDGLVALIFAATLGWGVGFSAVTVLVYQGALTLAASTANDVLSDRMIVEATATGGIMVMGIGLRLLDVKQVRVGSLLPALVLAPALVGAFAR